MAAEIGIKLMAKDAEDLAIVAACLQDALVPVSEIRFLKDENRLVMLLNRFRWERPRAVDLHAGRRSGDARFTDAAAGEGAEQRIHCGLCIDRVTAVRSRKIDLRRRGDFLSLLTIEPAPGRINLIFAGDRIIQLETEGINLFLQDFGEGWPTQWRPDHELAVGGSGAQGG
jgi:Protein of unknown function (DUF2948)